MSSYRVVDLTQESGAAAGEFSVESSATVDPKQIASQLQEISDAISPILDKPAADGGIGLESIELSLTIGAEGGVWFVAKGSAEASIKATFSRPKE